MAERALLFDARSLAARLRACADQEQTHNGLVLARSDDLLAVADLLAPGGEAQAEAFARAVRLLPGVLDIQAAMEEIVEANTEPGRNFSPTLASNLHAFLVQWVAVGDGTAQVWESRCHFCGGQCRPFRVPDALWPSDKLGEEQACFNCFYDAVGLNDVLVVRGV